MYCVYYLGVVWLYMCRIKAHSEYYGVVLHLTAGATYKIKQVSCHGHFKQVHKRRAGVHSRHVNIA